MNVPVIGKVNAYGYLLDIESNDTQSNQTYGINVKAKHPINDTYSLGYYLEYAFQQIMRITQPVIKQIIIILCLFGVNDLTFSLDMKNWVVMMVVLVLQHLQRHINLMVLPINFLVHQPMA